VAPNTDVVCGSECGNAGSSDANTAVEIKPTPSDASIRVEFISSARGLGVRATRAFTAGELILTEEPLLSVQREFSFPLGMNEDVMQARAQSLLVEALEESLQRLSSSERATFFAFACSQHDGRRSTHGIFRTNALETNSSGSVFALSSRLNHSCLPNVIHSWCSKTGTLTLRAAMDIPMDSELTIAYRARGLPCGERRAQLQREFGFVCECDLCMEECDYCAKRT
jgi:hypothetical protein